MGDFFKQLISQLSLVWEKLSLQQRIITASLTVMVFVGLLGLMLWGSGESGDTGRRNVFSKLSIEDLTSITEVLDQSGYKYEISQSGTAISVEEKDYYTVKMALAREGLPANKGVGWELFDQKNFGDSDFELKIKKRRALEGELVRTVEAISEVEKARVHIVIPEESLFLEEKREAKASVAIKIRSNRKLSREQVDGIAYLVASSVEGLDIGNISIVDYNGKVLSRPMDENDPSLIGSRNMELQQTVENSLERKITHLLSEILGSGKASVKVAAVLDFTRMESTLEKYDPESKVIRSEERNETSVTNAPDGDRINERSLSNYEIDKRIEHIIHEVGNVKRLSISVAVDGRYKRDAEGEEVYEPRTVEEVTNLEAIIKNSVGYDLARGDQISVVTMQFEKSPYFFETEVREQEQMRKQIITIVALLLILIVAIVLIRAVVKTMADVMNPPAPEVSIPDMEEEVVEVSAEVARQNQLLENLEVTAENDPVNIARIIKDWLHEPVSKKE